MTIGHWIAMILIPLTTWVVLTGIDDLFIAFVAGIAALRARFGHRRPTDADLETVPERRMAIFVCLWREHRVIREMIEHNVRNIRYRNYDFFIGVYPNDTPTVAAVTEVCRRFPNVHISVTPHPGGTSKADNLNWIFQRMLLHEKQFRVHFDMIVIHDAEDVIHPDDLRWMNYYAQWYDQVQIPVLALPTPVRQFTHGVYCDEFAEFQFKDMPARELLGGFLPSSGVGTGFSRRALEAVAAANRNQIFDATSLTEDYEIGYRIRRLGFRQKFIRIMRKEGGFVATREYFAQGFSRAVTQRSRWVTGIALQSWEKHGLRDSLPQLYWLWRDRKGFVSNLLTPLTMGVFIYGLIEWALSPAHAVVWRYVWWAMLLMTPQTAIRICCTGIVYGWKMAATVPFRALWANVINWGATVKAAWGYASARVHNVPLRWLKTEHAYPTAAALNTTRPSLGEVLVGCGSVTREDWELALNTQPPNLRIGEYLMKLGKLTEDQLYDALGLQHDLPTGKPQPDLISSDITRALPADLARRLKVLPFRVVAGQLYVASPEIPNDHVTAELRTFWPLEVRFHLVTPSAFKELLGEYLPPRPPSPVSGFLTGLGVLASLLAIGKTWAGTPPRRPAQPYCVRKA